MKVSFIFCFVLFCAARPNLQTRKTPDIEVRQTLAAFIRAFDDLEWDKSRAFFADDASVFYPRAIPERAQGRAEYEAGFRKVFEQIRGSKANPPYMDIQPRGLDIHFAGQTAIATFHLDDRPGFINRRTIVLVKIRSEWKIIHLHASEVRVP